VFTSLRAVNFVQDDVSGFHTNQGNTIKLIQKDKIMNCIMTILSVLTLFYIVKQLHFRWVLDNVDLGNSELRQAIKRAKKEKLIINRKDIQSLLNKQLSIKLFL
jgi:hypothetical protein